MKTKNSLPKYWVVQCNTHNPNWRKVIDYLKNVHGEIWVGLTDGAYYGYDGGLSCWNGTNVYSKLCDFKNSPVVLTIKEFVEMTEGFVIPKYVECIDYWEDSNGKIFDTKNPPSVNDSWKEILFTYGRLADGSFKPSTKEAFEQQNSKKETMRTITHTQAQSIINIACVTWKIKLAAKWSKEIVLKETIEISEKDYEDMRNACTPEQNELFNTIFGKDVKFIPKGTPCLVRDIDEETWNFAYSNGDGKFRTCKSNFGWKQVQVLDINNLPKY